MVLEDIQVVMISFFLTEKFLKYTLKSKLFLRYVYKEMEVSIRPPRHDQHPRFLYSAFPYYASMFSMIFGFYIFGFLFLHSSPKIKTHKD